MYVTRRYIFLVNPKAKDFFVYMINASFLVSHFHSEKYLEHTVLLFPFLSGFPPRNLESIESKINKPLTLFGINIKICGT